MRNRLISLLLVLLLTASAACHLWTYRKIREFSETFAVQGEIETKRTALMILYQEVLQNVVRQLDILRSREKSPTLELDFGEER